MKLNEGFKIATVRTETSGEVLIMLVAGVPEVEFSKKNPNSMKVSVLPKNGAENPITGYCFADSDIAKIFKKAAEEGRQILVKAEKQRKKGIDINISMAELTKTMEDGRKNINRTAVAVYDFANNKWINDSTCLTANISTPELDQFIQSVPAEDIDPNTFFASNETKPVKIENPSHFEKQNVLITFYYKILECERLGGFSLEEDNRRKIVKRFLDLADKLQQIIRGDNVVNYKDYSHTRARYLIFAYEENIKPLTREDLLNINDWLMGCYKYSVDLLEWTRTL